jgi:hypothetical protein
MRWTAVPPGNSCIDTGIHRVLGLSDCMLPPASPRGHLCKNASDLFAFVSDRPCGSSTTSTGRARVGENSLPLSPEPHAMRKRTDVAMIEALAWLRDLGLENGGTRCRPCARWRGRTSVRPSNPGGQKINFFRGAVRSGDPRLHHMTSLKTTCTSLCLTIFNYL